MATSTPPMETFQQAQPGMAQPTPAAKAPAPAQAAPPPVNHGHRLLAALVNGAHQIGQTLYDVNNPDLYQQRQQQTQDQLKQVQAQHDDQYRKLIFDSIADPNSTPEQRTAGGKLLQHLNDPGVAENEKLDAITGYIGAFAPKNPLTPDEQAKAAKIKAGLEPNADTTYRVDNPAPKEPKPDAPLEAGGAPYGVRAGGKEYLAADLAPNGSAPPQAKQIWATIQAAQQGKQANLDKKEQETQDRFNKSQERIAAQFAQTQANLGTWSVVEGDNGETKLLNSKTGEMKDAPGGLHKSGYYSKNIAPLEAANLNIDNYIDAKVYDGPGDLALQHEFFTATQPATGFRMTKVQQDILAGSQSWLNSLQAKAYHLATGTWFSDKQRQQIANAAREAIDAKKKALAGATGGPETEKLRQTQSGGANNDPLGVLK